MNRFVLLSLAAFALIFMGSAVLRAQPGFKEQHTDTTPAFFGADSSHDYNTALRIARWSNAARQKQLVKDTARLVELTRIFKEHMAVAGNSSPSEADIKLIGQIEKLAHTIREEMANAGTLPPPPRPHPDPW